MALRQEAGNYTNPFLRVVSKIPEYLPDFSVEKTKKKSTPAVAELLFELKALTNKAERRALIEHQLKALAREQLQIPFHSAAQEIFREPTLETQGFTYGLHDSLYLASSVLERCQRAVAMAQEKGDQALVGRYSLEQAQVEELYRIIGEEIPEVAGAFIRTVASEKPQVTTLAERQIILSELTNQGWQESRGLISPEVAWQLKIKPQTKCFAGPKFFDIMTKSSVHKHKGWKTMFNIHQPVYLPEYDRWIMLQDQHMADSDWGEYDQILTKLHQTDPHAETSNYLKSETGKSKKETKLEREKRVMSASIQLESKYQHLPATQVFLDLLYDQKPAKAQEISKQQQELTKLYTRIEQTFGLHADYLSHITDLELSWETEGEDLENQKQRFFQAFFNTFSAIYHNQVVTVDQLAEAAREYEELYRDPVARARAFELANHFRLASSVSLPFVLLKVESIFECSVLAAPSLLLKMNNSQFLSLVSKNVLSKSELEKLVGAKRARLWTVGDCVECGRRHTDIGECGWCKWCEFGPQLHGHNGYSTAGSRNDSKILPFRPFLADETESLNTFVAKSVMVA